MSWKISEKVKTSTNNILSISHGNISPNDKGVNTTGYKCLGYSNITVGYKISEINATNIQITLQGSNNDLDYFDIEMNTHTNDDRGYLKLRSSVKFIRIKSRTSGSNGVNTIENINAVLT